MCGRKERCHPRKTQARGAPWDPRLDILGGPGGHGLAHHVTILVFVVHGIRVRWIAIREIRISPSPAINVHEFPLVRTAVFGLVCARAIQGGIVLRADVYVVGRVHVVGDCIDLGDGQVVDVQPIGAPVIRNEQAAVIAEHDAVRIERVNPHGMGVKMQLP